MSRNTDLRGLRFGKLTVIARATPQRQTRAYWFCRCDCGRQTTVMGRYLRIGHTKSCGCLRVEVALSNAAKPDRNVRHGAAREGKRTREYLSWQGAKDRCYNPKNDKYALYGGRGITMCDEWRADFAAFLRDLGPRPTGTTLDRINSDGHYEPANCRWATVGEQNTHTARVRPVRLDDGRVVPLKHAIEHYGLSYDAVYYRVREGMDPQAAVDSQRR